MSDARPKTGIDLSLVQVLAGTGAALTAALLGSLFGIAGTLGGTALGSAVATICTALYSYQLHRTRERLQRRSGGRRSESLLPTSWRPLPWLRLLAAAAVVFGVALTALTVVEATLGHPLSSPSDPGSDRGGASTSLGRALAPDARPHASRSRRPDLPAAPTPASVPSPPASQSTAPSASPTRSESPRRRLDAPPHEPGPAGRESRVRPSVPDSEPSAAPPPTSGPFDATPSDVPPSRSVDSSTEQPTAPPSPSETSPPPLLVPDRGVRLDVATTKTVS